MPARSGGGSSPRATERDAEEGALEPLVLRRRTADVVVPLVLGIAAAGTAMTSVVAPEIAIGITAFAVLVILPFEVLLAVFVATSIVSIGHGVVLGPFNVLPGQLVLVPVIVRAFLDRGSGARTWGWPEWILVAWLGLGFATSALNAVQPITSVVAAIQLTIAATSYLVMVRAVDRHERLVLLTRVALITVALATALGIVAVIAHLLGTNALDVFLAGRPGTHKGVSTLPKGLAVENNIYGSFAASATVAFLVLARERHRVIPWRWAALGAAVCGVGTILSGTRAAWIGFVVGFVGYLLIQHRRTRRVGSVAGPLALSLVIGALSIAMLWFVVGPAPVPSAVTSLTTPLVENASEVVDFGEGTGAARLDYYRQAIDDLRASPIIGLGINSFGQRHLAGSEKDPKPARIGSLFLGVLHDTGMVGLLLFGAFLLAVVWPRRALLAAVGDAATIARALISAWVVLAVAFIATDGSLLPWPWIVLGLARAATRMTLAAPLRAGSSLAEPASVGRY